MEMLIDYFSSINRAMRQNWREESHCQREFFY